MPLKSFLNKMGLVEDDVAVTKAKTTAPAATAPASTAPQQTSQSPYMPSPYTTSYTPTPAIDPAIQDMLNQSLQENKLSGFDYLKFVSAVDETKATGIAEDARFKMTFSTAKQLGVNKDTLLKSGAHYVDVLAQDESDFNTDCANYEKNQVQSREAKLANIESTITNLNQQLSQLTQDKSTLTQELQQEKFKLESRKVAFRVTLESIRTTIKSNIDKINQYL